MSHLVTIKTEVRDAAAIRAACTRMKLPAPMEGEVKFFDGAKATGWKVQLPDWRYPIVCQASGQVKYDNFNGCWGKQVHLDRFIQGYACEKAKQEARRKGFPVTEASMPDGSIRLTILAR